MIRLELTKNFIFTLSISELVGLLSISELSDETINTSELRDITVTVMTSEGVPLLDIEDNYSIVFKFSKYSDTVDNVDTVGIVEPIKPVKPVKPVDTHYIDDIPF